MSVEEGAEECNRKRNCSEDEESVGSNSSSPNQLVHLPSPNMAQYREVIGELAKFRLKIPPYQEYTGWSDIDLWKKVIEQVFRGYSQLPKITVIVNGIVKMEREFHRDPMYAYKMMDPEFGKNIQIVFGPSEVNGPFQACLLDPGLLPQSATTLDEEDFSGGDSSNEEENSVCWNNGRITYTENKKLKVVYDQPSSPVKKKEVKATGKRKVLLLGSGLHSTLSNQLGSSQAGRFATPKAAVVSKIELALNFREDTKHLPPERRGRLLAHCSPTSSIYASIAVEPPEVRKANLEEYLKAIEDGARQSRSPPHPYCAHLPE